jgi:hypothetical protein
MPLSYQYTSECPFQMNAVCCNILTRMRLNIWCHVCMLLWQSFDPHVVIQPYPNGTCVKIFETTGRVFKELGSKPRGNTQAVLVAAGFSGEPRDFYLGVVHAETNRSYLNYFYKMQVGDICR